MRNRNLILNYVFISCLIVLFLNDHLFKFQYTSWFTGKLSDIVGIILLPMLLTYLFPKLKQNSVFVAGLFFAFWKSPFSESFIKIYNTISPISIHRVVDYTDLLVLLLLPIPYFLIRNSNSFVQFSIKKINVFAVLLPTMLVLMSTSPPPYYYHPKTGNVYFDGYSVEVNKPKEEIIAELKKRNINIYKDTVKIIRASQHYFFRRYDIKIIEKDLQKYQQMVKFNNDSIRIQVLNIIDKSTDYKIDSIKIGDEQIKNITIDLQKRDDNSSVIHLYDATIDKNLDEDNVTRKIKKQYRTLLKEYFLKK